MTDASELRAASRIEQVRAEAMEECAKVCDSVREVSTLGNTVFDEGWNDAAERCAEAIRALAQARKLREE